jgi:drug/metabolite transporter (DMT)-like permease
MAGDGRRMGGDGGWAATAEEGARTAPAAKAGETPPGSLRMRPAEARLAQRGVKSQSMIYLKLMLTALFWGGTFIAGRYVAAGVGPFSAAILRFCFATVLLLALTRRIEGRLPSLDRRQIGAVLLLGLSGVLAYNAFFFGGLRYVEAGRAAVIIATNPISITVFSALLFRERIGAARIAGILISVAGAIVVITKGNVLGIFAQGMGRGELLIFGCVLSWTAYSLLGKRVMGRLSPLCTVADSSAAGTALLIVPALMEGMPGHLTGYGPLEWAGIAYLGVFGTVIGFTWFYEAMQRIGPVSASQFINFVPINAVILAYLILREPLTRSLIIGTALVIAGVYLTNARAKTQSVRRGAPIS